jgi:hypothetical protein
MPSSSDEDRRDRGAGVPMTGDTLHNRIAIRIRFLEREIGRYREEIARASADRPGLPGNICEYEIARCEHCIETLTLICVQFCEEEPTRRDARKAAWR